MNCHCGRRMKAHGEANPFKVGAHHCNECGCCLVENGQPREGTNGCANWEPVKATQTTTTPTTSATTSSAVEAAAEDFREGRFTVEEPKPARRRRKS